MSQPSDFSPRSLAQLGLIASAQAAFDAAGVGWWLFGGWGLDAHLGRITREHGDVEFWVARDDALAAIAALEMAGFESLDTQPPEESREYVRELGGKLEVHSEVGRGSRFEILLPLVGRGRAAEQMRLRQGVA